MAESVLSKFKLTSSMMFVVDPAEVDITPSNRVVCPRAPTPPRSRPPPRSTSPEPTASTALRRSRSCKSMALSVLVVDDSETVEILRRASFVRVDTCCAEQARARIEADKVRLVLARQLDPSWKKFATVVALVPELTTRQRRAYLQSGFDDVTKWPLTLDKAHELLWQHVIPAGLTLDSTQPLSKLLRDMPGVEVPLRAGGLRGLLAVLHRKRTTLQDIVVPSGTPSVLIIDDSPLTRCRHAAAVTSAMKRVGYDLFVVTAHQDALDHLQDASKCFLLCLIDLRMPGLGGCACARALRAQGATFPFVAVTGAPVPGGADDDEIALAFDDLIPKPLLAIDVDGLVAKWILPRLDNFARLAKRGGLSLYSPSKRIR